MHFCFFFDMCGNWSIIQFVFFSSCVDTGVCVKNAHVARTCKSNPLPPNTMLTCTSPGLSASGCIIVAHSMSEGLGTYRVNFVWGGRGCTKIAIVVCWMGVFNADTGLDKSLICEWILDNCRAICLSGTFLFYTRSSMLRRHHWYICKYMYTHILYVYI